MIPYQKSNSFSPLINDYLDQKPSLQSLYNLFPTIENFKIKFNSNGKFNVNQNGKFNVNQNGKFNINQNGKFNINENDKFNINQNGKLNSNCNREILVDILKKQYGNVNISDETKKNIENLLDSNCFTITTGHQLNLFTGPLYFLYKIVSTINLCKQLKKEFPDKFFVPIYWMATEDHDFEEINYFIFKDRKISWKTNQTGAVGRFSLEGMDAVFEEFSSQIGNSQNAIELKKLFENAYLNHNNLADATRFLVNELFGKHGLVILDADNRDLKKQFIPYFKDELLNQSSYKKVTETNSKLEDYKIQVAPREINLFYLTNDFRERIVFENNVYKINNTEIQFTEKEILEELMQFPERFSPNVILRPLYQEVILPNLCYIGGGGEIAYWLQLKSSFDYNKVNFPMLLLRNSVLISTQKQLQKLEKLNLSWADLFLKQDELINNQTRKLSAIEIDFSVQKKHLQEQFENLYAIANQTDKSFIGAVKAQEKKQLNGLDNLEKRLLKAQKRKYFETLEQIKNLQNELFPNQSLQERQLNFTEFYLEFGNDFIEKLFENLKPLEQNFTILEL